MCVFLVLSQLEVWRASCLSCHQVCFICAGVNVTGAGLLDEEREEHVTENTNLAGNNSGEHHVLTPKYSTQHQKYLVFGLESF